MICSACRSIWICVSALALGLAAVARAGEGALLVRPADRDLYASEPRQVVTTSFVVTNDGDAGIDVEPEITAPPRWMVVAPPGAFALAARGSAVQLVSFTIPEDAPAGDYTVSLAARDRRDRGVAGSYAVRVRVTTAAKLQTTLLDLPDLAVAGDTLAAAVVFRNAGNAPLILDYTVRTRGMDGVSPRQGRIELGRAQSRRVDLALVVAPVRERALARVVVDARALVGGAVVESSASHALQVVARASARDALRLLDSRVETRYVARNSPAGRIAGWQPTVTGGGYVDEAREALVRYRLRGPDRRDMGAYGAPAEYWARLDTPHVSAGVGDLTFGLTPLTEPGRLGRGAELALHGTRWDFETYGMRDDVGDGGARQYAASTSWRARERATVALSYLERDGASGVARLGSVRAMAEPAVGLTLDAEFGRSGAGARSGQATRLAFDDTRFATRYYALGWQAGGGFAGPLRDKLYLSTGFDHADPAGWSWRGYYRMQDWNLIPLDEIDPDERERLGESERMRVAPLQRQLGLGTTHALGSFADLALDVVARERGARQSRAWRAGLSRAWRGLSLNYTWERGAARDRDSDTRFSTASQRLSGSMRLGRHQSYAFYWARDDGSELDANEPRRVSRGFTASYSFGALGVTLDAQRNVAAAGRSALYDLSVHREWEQGARLTLAARRIEGRFARDDYLVSYSIPFGMPVGRRPGFASVRGQVRDADQAVGLANIVLRMDGMAATTNRRGEFEFPAVRFGAHRIMLDRRSLDLQQVPDTLAPLEVSVGDETPPVSISLVRAVSIAVTVTVRAADLGAAPATGVLVRFRRGETEMRRLTDAHGRVRLGGVPPGRWVLSVAEDALPEGMKPAAAEVVLDLEPGGAREAEIALVPRVREMRMLAPVAVGQVRPSSGRR